MCIAAPLLLPVAAILQLFFPVLLRVQMRTYRWAILAVFGSSSILISTWLVRRFWPAWSADWLAQGRIDWSLAAIVASCTLSAWVQRPICDERPFRLEWIAFVVLFAAFGGRPTVSALCGHLDPDGSTALGTAAALALMHLAVRRVGIPVRHLTTQRVFLTVWCLADAAIICWAHRHSARPARRFVR